MKNARHSQHERLPSEDAALLKTEQPEVIAEPSTQVLPTTFKLPFVQRTSSKLGQIPNQIARQAVFLSIQRQFGNSYAAQVSRAIATAKTPLSAPATIQREITDGQKEKAAKKAEAISQDRINHILDGHSSKSTVAGKSKFLDDSYIESDIIKALRQGSLRTNPSDPDGSFLCEYSFEENIGVTGRGYKTNRIRVVVDNRGFVRTAHPD